MGLARTTTEQWEQKVNKILTTRELQVFQALGEGKTVREMAGLLRLSVKTVQSHQDHIRAKLGILDSHKVFMLAVRQQCDAAVSLEGGGAGSINSEEVGAEGQDDVPLQTLSPRLLQIFQALGEGIELKHIAGQLGISYSTASIHVQNLKQRLHCGSLKELYVRAVRQKYRAQANTISSCNNSLIL
ncbi:MAG: LuxR C-terminal-related transcriptional regulator [Candidatus Peribacteraceae bacterium]|jgi:DNA-binding NarL/FixJ family response regulator